MKIKHYIKKLLSLAVITGMAVAAGSAKAQTSRYWTGLGTWGTDSKWSLAPGGTYDQPWVSGDNAIFEGSPGTVTLGTAITANDITFTSAGSNYRIQGNTLDLTGGSITMATKNQKHTITSAITGSPASPRRAFSVAARSWWRSRSVVLCLR